MSESRFSPLAWAWSAVHAGVQTCFALPFTLKYLIFSSATAPDPTIYRGCMTLFAAHIVVDTALHWHKLCASMRLHHTLTLMSAGLNYFCGGSRSAAMVLLANETSTIFYSLRQLLPKGSVPHRVCSHAFKITFFATRIGLNSALLVRESLCPAETGAVTALLCLNGYWFVRGCCRGDRASDTLVHNEKEE